MTALRKLPMVTPSVKTTAIQKPADVVMGARNLTPRPPSLKRSLRSLGRGSYGAHLELQSNRTLGSTASLLRSAASPLKLPLPFREGGRGLGSYLLSSPAAAASSPPPLRLEIT